MSIETPTKRRTAPKSKAKNVSTTETKTAYKPVLNPTTTHLEFFGPIGCLLLTVTLPLLPFTLNFIDPQTLAPSWKLNSLSLPALVYLSWFAFQFALYILLPGTWVNGVELRNGQKLTYKINAFRALIATHVALAGLYYSYGHELFIWIANNVLEICIIAVIFSFTFSVLLYQSSFRSDTILLSTTGNSHNHFHDFFMGRELNPRISWMDLKYLCELRPGMFLWGLLNYAYLVKQWHEHGAISNSMGLVVVGQLIYISDSVWFEQAILTTMDITTDGFGFMLCVGDLVWVPFSFTMQARYLSLYPKDLSPIETILVATVFVVGYTLFRGSNSQKNNYRMSPALYEGKLNYIQTATGSRLLVSGYWGMSRHINYFGDWLMGISWCMCAGISSPVPWFYLIYFIPLLIHRSIRDDIKCRNKYGKDWDTYCNLVPSRIIPGIF